GPKAGESLIPCMAASETVLVAPEAASAAGNRDHLGPTPAPERHVDALDCVGKVARDVETDRFLREAEAAGVERRGRNALASSNEICIRERCVQRRADDVVHPVAAVRAA